MIKKIVDNLKYTYLSHIICIICIIILSFPNIILGLFTHIFIIFWYYISHIRYHLNFNVFTVLHNYHHDNNYDIISNIANVTSEYSIISLLFVLHYHFFKTTFLNCWIIIFCIIYYSTIHNINYSFFHVNNFHELHHVSQTTNYGPDIFDIIFNTKNNTIPNVENCNHTIINYILITIIILIIKWICKNECYKTIIIEFITIFVIFSFLFYLLISIILMQHITEVDKIRIWRNQSMTKVLSDLNVGHAKL